MAAPELWSGKLVGAIGNSAQMQAKQLVPAILSDALTENKSLTDKQKQASVPVLQKNAVPKLIDSAGQVFATPIDHPSKVSFHELKTFFIGTARTGQTRCQPAVELTKKPRIRQRPSANGDARTACQANHAVGIGNGPDVAVAQHRDLFYCFDHAANSVQIDVAGETLLAVCGGGFFVAQICQGAR